MIKTKMSFSKIKNSLNDNQTTVLRILFLCWCINDLLTTLKTYFLLYDKYGYQSFEISDWMINYQGGFVRRGIIGELLYQIYQIYPYPLRPLIFAVVIITFIVLLWLLFRVFTKNGWSYMLFPSYVLIVPCFTQGLFFVRKDFILLLGAFLLFYLYRRWLKGKSRETACFILFQTIGVLLMLIHEASFFFTVPILLFHFFCKTFRKNGHRFVVSTVSTVVNFLPILISWILACIYKGDDVIAQTVWNTWIPAMNTYPIEQDVTQIGFSVEWLGHSFSQAASFHLERNFGGAFIQRFNIPVLPFAVYCYVAIYYVVTRMQTIDLKINRLKPIDNVLLSNIVLVQFVFMLPMFTVLSCDGGRTVPYWIVSSLFFFHFFSKETNDYPSWLNKLSAKIQSGIDSITLLNNEWWYFIIIITIPLSMVGCVKLSNSYLFQIMSNLFDLLRFCIL